MHGRHATRPMHSSLQVSQPRISHQSPEHIKTIQAKLLSCKLLDVVVHSARAAIHAHLLHSLHLNAQDSIVLLLYISQGNTEPTIACLPNCAVDLKPAPTPHKQHTVLQQVHMHQATCADSFQH